jgi:hypothetical protein
MKQRTFLRYALCLLIALAAAGITMYFTEDESLLAYFGWVVFYIAINTPFFLGRSPSQCLAMRKSRK